MNFLGTLVSLFLLSSIVGEPLPSQALRLDPRAALVDTPTRIWAAALAPGVEVIVRASRSDSAGRLWQSYAALRADRRGTIDLSRQAPVHGSYEGVKPMGLLTSLEVGGDARGRLRYPVAWSDTLRTAIVLEVDGRPVSVDTLVQTFAAAGVGRMPVRDSGLVGMLFTPPGPAKRPGVLVLGGSEGGLGSADVAAVLASRGYVALALAYFGIPPLPPSLDEIPLEYFGRALDFLLAHPAVTPGNVGIIGTSKGAEAALVIASHYESVKVVVGYAPSHVVWSCICGQAHSSWTLRGVGLPNVPAGSDPLYRPPSGWPIRPTINYAYRLRDSATAARAEIPVERIRGPMLVIAGDDDGLWPSLRMARQIIARRRRFRVPYSDSLLAYPGAGHLIGKAYVPAGATTVGGGRLETGGSSTANATAQADSWPRVLAFLEASLVR